MGRGREGEIAPGSQGASPAGGVPQGGAGPAPERAGSLPAHFVLASVDPEQCVSINLCGAIYAVCGVSCVVQSGWFILYGAVYVV